MSKCRVCLFAEETNRSWPGPPRRAVNDGDLDFAVAAAEQPQQGGFGGLAREHGAVRAGAPVVGAIVAAVGAVEGFAPLNDDRDWDFGD